LGDFTAAQKYYEQALFIAREIGNLNYETLTLMNLSGMSEVQGKAQEAVQYAKNAIELSKKTADKPAEAWSYLYLGHAYSLMGQLEEAKLAFAQALNLRRQLRQPALATEPLAGLLQLALGMKDLLAASRLVEELMAYLSEGGTLEGTEEPLRVYLVCYQALESIGDPRSTPILETAIQFLQAQVSKIHDEQSRRMYIENVPWRRELEGIWQAKRANF
jgi:tetratricopeptide (TPR) repeat protein